MGFVNAKPTATAIAVPSPRSHQRAESATLSPMAFLIGTDEAGYGPNLGPLVISSSTWHAPDDLVDCDLYEILCDAVSRTSNDIGKVPIADSKQLYQPGKGLAALECGLFSLFATLGVSAGQWWDVWRALAESSLEKLN